MNAELPPTPPTPPTPPQPQPPDARATQWAVATHLSALAGMVIPVGNILAPLVIWLIKKPEMPSIDAVGRDVLNFQVSWTIWMIIAVVIGVVGSCLVVPVIVPIAAFIAWLVLTILGGVKASNGERYAHPLTLKMF